MILPSRFWAKVNKAGPIPAHRPDLGPCWLWAAAKDIGGYGAWGVGSLKDGTRRVVKTHRSTFEAVHGAVPNELEIDHLCRVSECCNPAHLEAVTHAENVIRGAAPQALRDLYASRTTCDRGHPMSGTNVRLLERGKHITRICRACRREWQRASRSSKAKGEQS